VVVEISLAVLTALLGGANPNLMNYNKSAAVHWYDFDALSAINEMLLGLQ